MGHSAMSVYMVWVLTSAWEGWDTHRVSAGDCGRDGEDALPRPLLGAIAGSDRAQFVHSSWTTEVIQIHGKTKHSRVVVLTRSI